MARRRATRQFGSITRTGRFAAIALALVSSAGAVDARRTTRASDTEVTLVIFSGRVDPVWALTSAQTAEFRLRLTGLPPAAHPYAPPFNLGYLSVLLPGPERPRQTVTIDHGQVVETGGGLPRSLVDPDRALEAWLLATGKDRTASSDRWFTIKDLDAHP